MSNFSFSHSVFIRLPSSLSGAYLQIYTSYGYIILWVDTSHQGGGVHIRITSVNSTNQVSDVCRRTTSGNDNNNPHSNVKNNMTTSNVFDFKQYEVDKMYSPQCKRETLYCYNIARSIKHHSPNF